jgi:hypothetical protein
MKRMLVVIPLRAKGAQARLELGGRRHPGVDD